MNVCPVPIQSASHCRRKPARECQITATDQEIDRLVYALYGLTADEIKLVEGK